MAPPHRRIGEWQFGKVGPLRAFLKSNFFGPGCLSQSDPRWVGGRNRAPATSEKSQQWPRPCCGSGMRRQVRLLFQPRPGRKGQKHLVFRAPVPKSLFPESQGSFWRSRDWAELAAIDAAQAVSPLNVHLNSIHCVSIVGDAGFFRSSPCARARCEQDSPSALPSPRSIMPSLSQNPEMWKFFAAGGLRKRGFNTGV